jgi:hypothetical protein
MSWNLSWWIFMEFHEIFHEILGNYIKFHETLTMLFMKKNFINISWNSMKFYEIPWNFNCMKNFMKFHQLKCHEIPWNFMKFHGFIKFGFDRVSLGWFHLTFSLELHSMLNKVNSEQRQVASDDWLTLNLEVKCAHRQKNCLTSLPSHERSSVRKSLQHIKDHHGGGAQSQNRRLAFERFLVLKQRGWRRSCKLF